MRGIRQLLDGVGTPKRIGHTVQEAFIAQQVVDVADHASRQHFAFRDIGRGYRKPVAASDDRGHGLKRGADQILVRGIGVFRIAHLSLDPRVV